MRKVLGKRIMMLGLILGMTLVSFKTLSDDIKGWFLAGSNPELYEIGTEMDAQRNGTVGFLKSTSKKISKKGFGTIMQQFTPKDYLGKRVKLSGSIKSSGVEDWAGMWMRVDGNTKKALSFDNMQDRPIKGTTGWKKYEIILDVPAESRLVAYGVLVSGPGAVWLDDFVFEVLAKDSETTNKSRGMKPSSPTNTDFEQ